MFLQPGRLEGKDWEGKDWRLGLSLFVHRSERGSSQAVGLKWFYETNYAL